MKFNQSNIKKAKKYLDKNYCIGVPTETVYGLAANAYSDTAIESIYKIKKRPKSNPLIVHYSSIKNLKEDCLTNDNFLKLYKKLSPGPITYILNLKKDSKISKIITNKKNNLAVRFPKHKIFRKLLNKLNYPVAAPSANISTRLSAVQASDIKEDFGTKVKYILDGGKCNIGLESTIIDLRNKPKILRLGGLEINKIKKILNKKNNLAVRFPKHRIFRKLLNNLKYPVAAPSANISTRLSAVQASDIKEDFGSKVKYILDGGKCNIGLESTIIDLRNKPKILRLGGLEIDKIKKILNKKINVDINPKKRIAPGQSKLHYSPGIPLRMNAKKPKKNEAFILLKNDKKIYSNYFYLSKKNNLKEAARNLYSVLRKIKNSGYKSIAIEKIKNFGIGQTINDRLKRASKF